MKIEPRKEKGRATRFVVVDDDDDAVVADQPTQFLAEQRMLQIQTDRQVAREQQRAVEHAARTSAMARSEAEELKSATKAKRK